MSQSGLFNYFRYHRRRYQRMRAASIILQKHIRGYLGRKHYRAMRTGYMRLQALIRSRILSHKFKHLRGHIIRLQVVFSLLFRFKSSFVVLASSLKQMHLKNSKIICLQARSRGYLIRREHNRKFAAIIKIQSHVRRVIAQRNYRKLKVSINLLEI